MSITTVTTYPTMWLQLPATTVSTNFAKLHAIGYLQLLYQNLPLLLPVVIVTNAIIISLL